MNRGHQGEYVRSTSGPEHCDAYVPFPIPPRRSVQRDEHLYEQALVWLGRLDSIKTLLPDSHLFIYQYMRKEALLSSQIEGTQSSLADLLLFETGDVPALAMDEAGEVLNYVAALGRGLSLVNEGGLPLCNRLIRDVHRSLLRRGRGARAPGEFRKRQNWIGGPSLTKAVFVPPPPDKVDRCMGQLEEFLNMSPSDVPALIKAALAHVQFETIHPFLDGNGRVGRLLITLVLCYERALGDPLLYLSLYLKANREEYYDLLQRVRLNGDWEAWLDFFLSGIISTCEQAVETAHRIARLFARDASQIEEMGKAVGNTLRVHQALQRKVFITGPGVAKELDLALPTVLSAIDRLQEIGILKERTGKLRGRIFQYDEYWNILKEGTDPLTL